VSRFTTALGKYACALVLQLYLVPLQYRIFGTVLSPSPSRKILCARFQEASRGKSLDELCFHYCSSCWPICSCNAQSRVKTGCSHADFFICTLSPPHARESSVSPHACIYPIYQDTANRLAASISIFTASPSEPLVHPRVPSTPSAWVSAWHHFHSITVQRISS
jgi:hypothetical protein